jgi:signal peptidase I
LGKKNKSFFREWLEAILIALAIVLLVRSMAVEAFLVPTPSMEKTLMAGDFILVNKLSYGPRVLVTPLTMPFAHQTMPFSNTQKGYLGFLKLPYFRLPGFGRVKHNDIVVFNYPLDEEHPVDHKTHYVKRCVALPGDTLEIRESRAFVGGIAIDNSENLQFNFAINASNDDPEFYRVNYFAEGGRYNKANEFRIPLTIKMAEELAQDEQIAGINPITEPKGISQDYIFPYESHFSWNVDHFGPVVVPGKGMSVVLSDKNIALYRRIIEKFEGNLLEEKEEGIFINGEKAEAYTFKMDYYFMMGDNRHYSSDSRFWGFVPEDHILGKASMVIFSMQRGNSFFSKIRWGRIFTFL